MNLVEHLQWRYATKKFDPTLKISDNSLAYLKKAIQLSASSYGLQSFKTVIITDKEVCQQLKAASWNQTQVVDASHLIVFCNHTAVTDEEIDQYLQHKSKVQNIPLKALDGYGQFMKSRIGALSEEEVKIWTAKQVYIAMGNLLAACAELKIDACPMEGFEPAKYDEILELSDKKLTACVAVAVGYRSEEDKTQFAPKVRKSMEDLFVEL